MLEIPSDLREQMIGHAVDGLPNEACGLLAGVTGRTTGASRAERFYPMTNADHSAYTYRLDPKEQLDVLQEIEDKGWDVVGIFHSHTHTEAYPSATDRDRAYWPDRDGGRLIYPDAHYVLVSLADRNSPVLRAFTIGDDGIHEQELMIT